MFLWWSFRDSIRTPRPHKRLNLSLHYYIHINSGTLAGIIECNLNVIIPKVDRIHKGINNLSPEPGALHIPVPELFHPVDDEIPFDVGKGGFLQTDGIPYSSGLCLQFHQPPLCGNGNDSSLNGLHDILGSFLVFREIVPQASKY